MKIPTPQKTASGYRIQLRLNGVSIPVTAPTAKECIRQAELIKAEHRTEKRLVSKNSITLRQAIDKYIAARDGVLSPSTIRGYEVIKRNAFPEYTDKPMKDVNWQAAVNAEAKRLAAKTVANEWGLVSSILRENRLPVPDITLPQKIRNEHPWLTPEQIPVFLKAILGTNIEFPCLLALHGLRKSEIYALNEKSFSGNMIHVRGAFVAGSSGYVLKSENKNTSSRRDVPILIPRLSELLEDHPPMFEYSAANLSTAINRVCERNGLPKVGTHGLRHSFASLCYHMGLSEHETMELGGWSDPATMRKIYTHISKADKDAATQKLKSFFSEK